MHFRNLVIMNISKEMLGNSWENVSRYPKKSRIYSPCKTTTDHVLFYDGDYIDWELFVNFSHFCI